VDPSPWSDGSVPKIEEKEELIEEFEEKIHCKVRSPVDSAVPPVFFSRALQNPFGIA